MKLHISPALIRWAISSPSRKAALDLSRGEPRTNFDRQSCGDEEAWPGIGTRTSALTSVAIRTEGI